jgi:hypothetical protein
VKACVYLIAPRIRAPEQQVAELRFALAVEADDLAIQNRRPGAEFAGNDFTRCYPGEANTTNLAQWKRVTCS